MAIVSTEIIKPCFPTPTHLKTYYLSVFDQFTPNISIPLVTFYPNTCTNYDQIILNLKNSLSHILAKYYPFAGRHANLAPAYVDCNDHGAEFIEASIDCSLSDFLQKSRHEDLERLFPYERVWNHSNRSGLDLQSETNVVPLAVQVNRFECGGVALAVSLSHKIADACSLIRFLSDWGKMTRARVCSNNKHVPIEPYFISFENTNINFSRFSLEQSNDGAITRSFVFPDAKINELKIKVRAKITNPTRVEVLIWLLYKCAVGAATKTNSGSFKPSSIRLAANLRDKMIEPLPENSIGNFLTVIQAQIMNEMELKPDFLIGELRKQKMKTHGLKNIEASFAPLLNKLSPSDLEEHQMKFENAYLCTILCRYPAYGIDFGFGTPIKATMPAKRRNSFILMDTPDGKGVEVLVCLGKQDMHIMESDPELLPCAIIN